MYRRMFFICIVWSGIVCGFAQIRHWTVADGMPTGEVQQIVELPNGQMLIDCDGVYCLSNGNAFDVIEYDHSMGYVLPKYVNQYGHFWQGDSLLWLRSFYKVFLFDANRREFIREIEHWMKDPRMQQFIAGQWGTPETPAHIKQIIDSVGLSSQCRSAVVDRQGGIWIGTQSRGIYYLPPHRPMAQILKDRHPLIELARSTVDEKGCVWHCKTDGLICDDNGKVTAYDSNHVTGMPEGNVNFIQSLPDGRYLLCLSYSKIGYFMPESHEYSSLNDKLPVLSMYRHFVGACPLDERQVAIYSQNGIFILDTQTDSIKPFMPAQEIEKYSEKYNCMLKAPDGHLWIGTQNGLFCTTFPSPREEKSGVRQTNKVDGLQNNCIRSLVTDAKGNVWAGTSSGISRITPTVINLGNEDGVPTVVMMERAAMLGSDSCLVFVTSNNNAVKFYPDSLVIDNTPPPVVVTRLQVNNMVWPCAILSQTLTLNHNQNSLVFQFSTLDYATPSHTQYRYRLLPTEQEWKISSNGSGQGTAIYSMLQHGNYTLEIQAGNAIGEWGTVTRQEIIIHPPLWLTWWAKLLYVLSTLVVLFTAISIYLKKNKARLERENDERVNQLFELRDNARRQFAKSLNIDAKAIAANTEEEYLVNKLMKSVSQNLDNEDYTVDQLASDIGMSRASLYKKTQLMLGLTPSDFMRGVRLKQAAKFLSETTVPIHQIASMVGFQTARNFSLSFKQMFGVTPTEYRSGHSVEAQTSE